MQRGRFCQQVQLLPAHGYAPAGGANLPASSTPAPTALSLCPAPACRRCRCRRSAWAAALLPMTTQRGGCASGPPGRSILTSKWRMLAWCQRPARWQNHCTPVALHARSSAQQLLADGVSCLAAAAAKTLRELRSTCAMPLSLQHVERSDNPFHHHDGSGVGRCNAARRRRQ